MEIIANFFIINILAECVPASHCSVHNEGAAGRPAPPPVGGPQ